MGSDRDLRAEMGQWLQDLTSWNTFSTWTFEHPVTPAGAMHQARRHLARLEYLQNGWTSAAAGPKNGWGYVDDPQMILPRERLCAFIGAEDGGVGGLIHIHALVGNVGQLRPYCGERVPLKKQLKQWHKGQEPYNCCMVHAWSHGIARVFPYDPRKGAAYYVGRYISKRLAEWEIIGFGQGSKNS